MCASPDTLIDTPQAERAIDAIEPGDLVFSMESGARVAVPVLRVSRSLAPATHVMVRATLSTGAAIMLSPGHPTADGRTFADLDVGDRLGALSIRALELVPYEHAFTVDILPESSSGTYFAGGALVGSTLKQRGAGSLAGY
jgi:hypothetical protein